MPRHPSLGKRLRRQSGSILPILAGHAIAEATGRSSPDSRIGDDVTGDEQQRATTAPPPTPSFPAHAVHPVPPNQQTSEERPLRTEFGRTCCSRWSPAHYTTHITPPPSHP